MRDENETLSVLKMRLVLDQLMQAQEEEGWDEERRDLTSKAQTGWEWEMIEGIEWEPLNAGQC